MKIKLAIAVLAACGALAASSACSKEKSGYESDSSSGELDDESSGAEDEPRDDSPVVGKEATQVFDSLKQQWSLQIESQAAQVDTIRKVMAEQKSTELDASFAELDPRIAALRKKIAEVQPSDGMAVLSVDMPKEVGETAELVHKAMLRTQEVIKANIGGR